MLEPRKAMEFMIGLKLDRIPDEKINEWMGLMKVMSPSQRVDALDRLKKVLEARNELELLIGLKLDYIPDEKIIQWMGYIKDPSPQLKIRYNTRN